MTARPLLLIADASLETARALAALAEVFAHIDGRRVIVLDRAPALAPAGPRLLRLQRLRALTATQDAWLFVKERGDLALAVGADGIHLGEGGVPSAAARRFGLRLSRACHDRAGLVRAGADLVLLSPIAAPLSGKPLSGPPLGVAGFAKAVAGLPTPTYALGGVDAALAPALRRAGAAGLALLGGVLLAPSPGLAAAALLDAWDGAQ